MEKAPQIYIQGKKKQLFSRGILAQKLRMLGFSLSEGYEFSIQVYNDLTNLHEETIDKKKLDEIVSSHLKKAYSAAVANKYLMIEKWRGSNVPLLILISGAIGAGKSTLSRQIAGDLGIQHVVGTQVIRDILRKVLSADVMPELHSSSYKAFQTLRPIYSSRFDEVLLGFENHSKLVNIGVDAILSRAEKESVSVVVEGEHLLPAFFDDTILKKSNAIYITMAVPDPEMHRENLSSQYTQEKEDLLEHFENIRKIHEHLINETKIRKLPLIETIKGENAISKVRELVVDKIVSLVSSQ